MINNDVKINQFQFYQLCTGIVDMVESFIISMTTTPSSLVESIEIEIKAVFYGGEAIHIEIEIFFYGYTCYRSMAIDPYGLLWFIELLYFKMLNHRHLLLFRHLNYFYVIYLDRSNFARNYMG